MRVIAFALFIAACVNDVSTGMTRDPLLFGSGPRASAVLAMAPAIHGLDHRQLDCDSLVDSDAGLGMCTLLVTCALPFGPSLEFGGIEFPGDAGLAPGWARGDITIQQRQAVSACVLANLSFDGLVGVASMRGMHLPVLPEESLEWSVEEGAFFGDLMAVEPIAVACRGVGDPASSERHERLCAQPDPDRPGLTKCGLVSAGACSRACGHRHGPYHQCNVGRREFTRIVTTFVEP